MGQLVEPQRYHMDNKLVAMFVALVGGCYLYLFLGNLTGIIDLPLNYSTLLPILGVTTILFHLHGCGV